MFTMAVLVGKVAKVACFTGVEGSTSYIIFMLAFILLVADVAKVAGYMWCRESFIVWFRV